jgi:hypothetical protein
MANQNNSVSASEILIPVVLVGLVLFLSLGFQTMQVLRDRDALHQYMTQQDKPLEESRKVQAQVSALALGTKKLADGGDKNAAAIIERMQKLGITVGDQPAPGAAPADAAAPTAAPPAQ